MHLQPLYSGCKCYAGAVAEDLFNRGICLPSSSSLTEEDQRCVINVGEHPLVRRQYAKTLNRNLPIGDTEFGRKEADQGDGPEIHGSPDIL